MKNKEQTFDSKESLYLELVKRYKKTLKENNVTLRNIDTEKYPISQRQIFYMQNIAEGKKAPDISKKKMKALLELLNIKLDTQCYFKIIEQ